MGLRPRTARRLALIASLLVLLVGGGVAFFTIPKLQNARQLRGFQREGMVAHEEGRHSDAVMKLGRFLRAMRDKPVDPEVRLAFARSRVEWEAANGGHLPAAIAVYREYLREKPDDREASIELLGMFVRTGAWTEARDLAVRLRPNEIPLVSDEQLEIIRHEVSARIALNPTDPLILQIEDRLLAAEHPTFGDAWRAFSRSEQAGNAERSGMILDAYTAARPDSVGSRFLKAWYAADGLGMKERTELVAEALNLDIASSEWISETDLENPELVRIAAALFEAVGRSDLALRVLESAAEMDPAEFGVALIRRLYWSGQFERVLGLAGGGPESAESDLFGYAAFIAQDRKDAALLEGFVAKLTERDTDFRALGWLKAIEARSKLAAGDAVGARIQATSAIEQYALEPTFRLLMGDIHDRLGRSADAIESWSIAEDLAKPAIWPEPGIRRITALMRAGRLIEAGDAAVRLVEQTPFNLQSLLVRIQTDAVLARSGLLNAERLQRSLDIARVLREQLGNGDRSEISLIIASLEAGLGNKEAAKAELALVLGTNSGSQIVAEAMSIDQAFRLGLATKLGPVELPDRATDPESALRVALHYVNDNVDDRKNRVLEAIGMLDAGTTASKPETRAAWLRAGAAFRDATGEESAAAAWKAALAADPKNIALLTEAIESNALGYDAEFVQASIDTIVELTATQGRTLPSRLRLARARSIFGRTPTKQRRDEAISIARAVVATEPQNLAARTLLANMLQFPCPPTVQGRDRFSPDLTGAIEQYVAAASLIPGPEAFAYLLKAADLHIIAGNETQARQLLLDLLVRTRGDTASQERIAFELNRIGDSQTANRLLGELFASSDGASKVSIGLQLAETAIAANDRARAETVLRGIIGIKPMTVGQLADLAGKLRKIGLASDVDRVLADAEGYGLSEREAILVRAQVAAGSGNGELAVQLLTAATEKDPNDADTWKALIRVLVDQGRGDEAAAQADRALAVFPDDDALKYWKQIALNDPAAAIRIMTERPDADEALKLAIKRVEDYDARRETLTRDQRLAELRDLASAFPGNAAVIKFVFRERFELGDDPATLADAAVAASRRLVGDEDILRMAAEATFRAGRFTESARIAAEWRGRTRGSPLQPDLYAAQAAQSLGDDKAVLDRLEPYLAAATSAPDEAGSPTVLLLYGRSAIRLRGEPAARARLEPVARQSERFRASVWLELAAIDVPQASSAADWLRLAEQLGVSGSEILLAEAWMDLAQRFPQRGAEFAMNAVRVSASTIEIRGEDVRSVEAAGRANLLWAEYLPENEAANAFAQAESFFARAAQLDPSNQSHRFQAAGAASRAGRPYEAERHYRQIIEDPTSEGLLLAAARNNLAGLLSLVDPNPTRLREAEGLSQQAASFQPPIAAFHGTRGWVLLGLGRAEEAADAFQEAARLDNRSIEAWAGLSIARKASGSPQELVDEAMNQARGLKSEVGPITAELRQRLTVAGVDW